MSFKKTKQWWVFLFAGILGFNLIFAVTPQKAFASPAMPVAAVSNFADTPINSCESVGGALGWVMCPVLEILDSAMKLLDKLITDLLFVPVDKMFNQNDGIKTAWSIIRNLAYIILIPLMLVMVIGTALGFGPFDAYTVKKALPRMVAATIFMSISFYICVLLVQVSNSVGQAVLNLMGSLSPHDPTTGKAITSLTDVIGIGGDWYITAGTALIGLGSIAVGAVTVGVVASFALVAVVGLLIGYFTLAIRQVLIVVLIVFSPFAVLSWIFPGNDRIWKIWKDTLIAMLMMFPLIMILLGGGRFFAATVAATGAFDAVSRPFIELIAFIAPYFFIPATFKAGMGAFHAITGGLRNRSQGFLENQRKFRAGQREKYRQRAREGNRFAGGNDSNFRGKLNRGISGTLSAPGAILDSGSTFRPQNWRAATRAATQNNSALEIERNMKENKAYQSWMFDDGLNKAASNTRNAAELRSYLSNMRDDAGNRIYEGQGLEDAVNRVESVRRSMSTPAFQAMTARQALAGGTAYKSSNTEGAAKTAAGEAWLDVAKASVNDDAMASYLVANGRSEGMKAGRIDYAGAGFGTTLGVVNEFRRKLRAGEEITQADLEAATQKIHKDVYEGQGGASLVHSSMKPDAVKDMAPEMVRTIDDAIIGGDSRNITQSFASLAAIYDGMQGSSPAKARVIADNVLSKKIDVSTLPPEMQARLDTAVFGRDKNGNAVDWNGEITYQQAIEALRGNSEFKEMRREYANDVDRIRGQAPPEPGADITARPGQP